MRVTIASTPVVDRVGECLLARRWEGVSEGGIPVLALILAISPQSNDPAVAARFAAEFHELPGDPRAVDEPVEEVDRARVAPLAAEILRTIRPDLARQPPHRHNVFVVLNALAFAGATVIAGAGHEAREFFERALADNIAGLAARPGAPVHARGRL